MNFLIKKLKINHYKKENIINFIQVVHLIILLILIKHSYKNRLFLSNNNNNIIQNEKFGLFHYFI